MTTKELEPELLDSLKRGAENRPDFPPSPLEVDINYAAEALIHIAEADSAQFQVNRRAIDFLTKIVGWASRSIDENTGLISVASYDLANDEDRSVDEFGRGFLQVSPHIATENYVSETHTVDSFSFHQLRSSGKVYYVKVHRYEPLSKDEDNRQVHYYLQVENVGKYDGNTEKQIFNWRVLTEVKNLTMPLARSPYSFELLGAIAVEELNKNED